MTTIHEIMQTFVCVPHLIGRNAAHTRVHPPLTMFLVGHLGARLALVFFLISLPLAVARAAEVTYLVKPVEVLRAGERAWVPLNVGDEVVEGDAIRTGKGGRVEVTLAPKRVFRVSEITEVVLDSMVLREAALSARFRIILGRFWTAILDPLRAARGESLVVETPTVTIGIKGTRFDVDFDPRTQGVQTLVLEGQVEANPQPKRPGPPIEMPGPREIAPPQEVTRDEWTLLVGANQKLIYLPGREPILVPITDEDLDDEWVRFNDARDATLR